MKAKIKFFLVEFGQSNDEKTTEVNSYRIVTAILSAFVAVLSIAILILIFICYSRYKSFNSKPLIEEEESLKGNNKS